MICYEFSTSIIKSAGTLTNSRKKKHYSTSPNSYEIRSIYGWSHIYPNNMEQESNQDQFSGIDKSSRIAFLIAGFITKELSQEEEEELDRWLGEGNNLSLFLEITDEEKPIARHYLKWYQGVDVEKNLASVRKKLGLSRKRPLLVPWRYVAAACFTGAVILIAAFLLDRKRGGDELASSPLAMDISPGTEYAQLKMADGRLIILSEHTDTVINAAIKVRDGEVVASPGDPGMQEIIIPRKAYYKLQLPDGTKVFLNAESSIRFPGKFGDVREVSVTGETFFEVAKDADHPFIVNVNGIQVQALGTAFNVKAYSGEDIQTTLIEGRIRVKGNEQQQLLLPGEQISISGTNWKHVKQSDLATVTAWTKNTFRFRDAGIRDVMRLVERWYDAKVVYNADIKTHFNGTINRNVPVSQLLKLLEETGAVKFEIKDNVITIMK